jgi:formate dehydrogenase (NADP+) beta subunit
MAQVVFGVWDGVVHDARNGKIPAESALMGLKKFEDFDDGNGIRAFFGDRGFFVFDEKVSLIDGLYHYMEKAAEQSCGQCTPCRMGTVLVRDALDKMRRGLDSPLDFDDIELLGQQMKLTSLCGLGQTCSVALLDAIHNFRDRLEAEIADHHPIRAQHGMAYMTAPCIEACPAKVNVPRYIDYIRDGKPENSLGVLLQKYPMAATCGRVCVRYCELACRRKFVDEAVGIKTLKRYVADQQKGPNALKFTRDMIKRPQDGMKVAVIGAGPAGISAAYHLLLHGYHVDVFEKTEQAGGMAQIGIPSYRLPKDTLALETDIIVDLGGHFRYGQALGRDFSIDNLFAQGYKAVFLALGCQQGTALGVDNEDVAREGYYSGIDFLLKVHDHVGGIEKLDMKGEVVVVGGGNVAMDCVRSSLRLGADNVHVIYRRTEKDMPADHEELEAAHHEGIHFHTLCNPTRILADENGKVVGVELVRMEQTEPDESGRRKVRPVPGSEFTMPCDTIIAAIGQQVENSEDVVSQGIDLNRWKTVQTDRTLATSRPGVFAGGDCVTGPSTLIIAMATGLKAARNIDDWIQLGTVRFFKRSRMRQLIKDNDFIADDVVGPPVRNMYRVHNPALDPELRKHMFEEVEQTISDKEAYAEARRCMRCYRIYSVVTAHSIPEGAS